jgi:raffinose/stachyose/melibiose transport system substrate-binding protein
MKSKMFTKVLCVAIALVFVLGLAGCGAPSSTGADKSTTVAPTVASTVASSTEATKAAGPVSLTFFSNLPDRSTGQGKLEQQLIDSYMKENTNVKIEIEALQDEPYKTKFKAYTASNSIPDFYSVWGQPSFFVPVMQNGFAAELNTKDYESYGFLPNSLDGFSNDGKLYGLPRNTDEMVIYYNKDIFAKNSINVPTTLKELKDVAKVLRAKGIAPCATNGKDKWTLAILYHDLALKLSGDNKLVPNAVNKKASFAKDENLINAAKEFKGLMDVKFFQDSFTSADYGAARNLFGQGKAAMFYMGSWEMSMVSDAQLPEAVRNNMAVMRFPAVDGGKGKVTDEMAWNGGGYAVAANSKVKDEAVKLLNYIYKPENWAKEAWGQGICMPAQKFDTYMTGKETSVQKDIVNILLQATSLSGVTVNDLGSPSFKTDSENLCQQLAAGMITPEKFLDGMDKAAAK